jgi:hypothetical protein
MSVCTYVVYDYGRHRLRSINQPSCNAPHRLFHTHSYQVIIIFIVDWLPYFYCFALAYKTGDDGPYNPRVCDRSSAPISSSCAVPHFVDTQKKSPSSMNYFSVVLFSDTVVITAFTVNAVDG